MEAIAVLYGIRVAVSVKQSGVKVKGADFLPPRLISRD